MKPGYAICDDCCRSIYRDNGRWKSYINGEWHCDARPRRWWGGRRNHRPDWEVQ